MIHQKPWNDHPKMIAQNSFKDCGKIHIKSLRTLKDPWKDLGLDFASSYQASHKFFQRPFDL